MAMTSGQGRFTLGALSWRALTRVAARQIVQAAYQGVLHRDADAAGLQAYSQRLQEQGDLTAVLRALSASDEQWQLAYTRHAPQLVDAMLQALLERPADPALRDLCVSLMQRLDDLPDALTAMTDNQVHWEAMLRRRAPDMARALHHATTGAVPDSAAVERTARRLSTSAGLAELVNELCTSELHWKRLLQASPRAHDLVLAMAQGLGLAGTGQGDPALREATDTLQRTGDPARALDVLTRADSALAVALQRHARAVAQDVLPAMLGRLPTDDEVEAATARVAQDGGLAGLLSNLLCRQDHLAHVLRQPSHACSLVAAAATALTGAADDPDAALDDARSTLQDRGDTAAAIACVAASPAARRRARSQWLPQALEALHLAFVGRQPTAEELAAAAVESPADLAALAFALASSPAQRARVLQDEAPALIHAVYRGLLDREPDPAGMATYLNKLQAGGGLTAVIRDIGKSSEHRVWLERQAPKSMAAVAAKSDGLRLKGRQPAAGLQAAAGLTGTAVLLSGWNDIEPAGFSWSTGDSRLLVQGSTRVHLTANASAQQPLSVRISWPGHAQVLTLDDDFSFAEVHLDVGEPTIVQFQTLGPVAPVPGDARQLAFQLWASRPPTHLPPAARSGDGPVLVFVHQAKKEFDSLAPVAEALAGEAALLMSVSQAVGRRSRLMAAGALFVVASAEAYSQLETAGLGARVAYLEHGVAPLKRYTYAEHYLRYEALLLPGDLWGRRLQALYPQLAGRCQTVGFPKLRTRTVSASERRAYCQTFGLDPQRCIVLFAPSWSGGHRSAGIHQIDWFDPATNLLTIPHDGDFVFAPDLREQGWKVHLPEDGESISDHYPFADVLVSDVSSTAIEFAALGKQVLCMRNRIVTDFDPQFQDEDLGVTIPHTGQRWDFCPVVGPEELRKALAVLAEPTQTQAQPVPQLVLDMCACWGQEAASRAAQALRQLAGARSTTDTLIEEHIA